MLVLKFGGSALVDADAFRRAAAICADLAKTEDCVLAVVSAMYGVTDALERGEVAKQTSLHLSLLAEFGASAQDLPQLPALDPDGIEALALGERFSTQILAAACTQIGLRPHIIDPGALGLTTDEHPREARPQPGHAATIRQNLEGARGLILVPGFYGRDAQNRIRLLGRNASDLSAAIFATASSARRLEVVASVSGLLSADPALVPEARLIPVVTYDEVLEMARGGAPVLHPDAIRIARDEHLEIRLRSLIASPTSTISEFSGESSGSFRALVHRERIALVHLEPKFAVSMSELSAALFAGLDRSKIKPIAVLASSSILSLAVLPSSATTDLLQELEAISILKVDNEAASLELVGPGLADLASARAEVLTILNQARIPILMLSEPAGRHALHLAVPRAQLREAAQLIHATLWPASEIR